MWNNGASVSYINSHVEPRSLGNCAAYVRRAVEAGGVHIQIPPPRIGNSASACDYGPSLVSVGFKQVYAYTGTGPTDTTIIPGQQTGDVVVIQPIDGHPHGHIALFNGTNWVSDFIQLRGFYPGQQYRIAKPAYTLYRYTDNAVTDEKKIDSTHLIKIVWPIPSNNRGSEFANQEEILSHVGGESTGLYMIGRNGMWHGGIHITSATTPWCGLSGKAASERIDFPVPFKGEQAVRCMADGEVVAYRVCKDYMQIKWETGPLSISGSFVLVKHYIQPGKKEESGLHFYTLYMHLAPYSAYTVNPAETKWTVKYTLSAYDPEWVMTASTNNKDTSESYKKGTMPKGAIVEWDKTDSSLHTVAYNKREYGLVTYVGLTEDAQQRGKKTTLKPGQQYWVLVDKNNISPGTDGVDQPSWWQQLLPPAKEIMKFDQVVCPAPYAISAGDPVGHMGYYQAAKDGGYEPRYQVHIECMSMDDNLEKFLTNPEKVGEKNPLYLKYSPGLELFKKDVATGTFTQDKMTERTGILTLSQVTTDSDKTTKQEYWQLRPENAYVQKGQAEPELLSLYDLAKLGFRTEIAEPSSFDYLDGKTQPTGFFRSVIDSLHSAAQDDTRASHALVKHNYQRLLDKIDSGATDYSSLEYASAFHNPDYRDVTLKTIVKHPSDWYFKKDDAIWQPFLNALKKEAPEWKKYSEAFLDQMAWMQDVTTEKLGASLWHMHPIAFLGSLKPYLTIDWRNLTKQQFVDAVYAEALKDEKLSGIPAPVTTAQAIEESNYGKKVMVDINSSRYSYNLFGIKAKDDQDYVENWTSEYVNGKKIKIIDEFAAYNSFEESISDRARFLKENKRYASLFTSDDPIKWAKGLQEKGYATNPDYAKNLIAIMKGSYMKSRGLK
ncbi:Peptidoglycan hydrolase flgJ [Buttiauxella agrestis]|uniref:Peptidoglycan hydrolase flgJ n=1 Tax=Buttiauxella agrestis TaxID=82977 RepID=A0A381KQ07_9ENTR|nr:glucosaminidase domain-containing protein [Buttiauxella agrestis]SUY92735.1 Peptidoglycan hydrolase flgJ [Buttiauxella agrestis]